MDRVHGDAVSPTATRACRVTHGRYARNLDPLCQPSSFRTQEPKVYLEVNSLIS
jgi:hypothetical protein